MEVYILKKEQCFFLGSDQTVESEIPTVRETGSTVEFLKLLTNKILHLHCIWAATEI